MKAITTKEEFIQILKEYEEFKKNNIGTDPNAYILNFGGFYIASQMDPTSYEPILPSDIPIPSDYRIPWWNLAENKYWVCTNPVQNELAWEQYAFISDIPPSLTVPISIINGGTGAENSLDARTNLGFNINSNRFPNIYTNRTFNTVYSAPINNDVKVKVLITHTNVAVSTTSVYLQISPTPNSSDFKTVDQSVVSLNLLTLDVTQGSSLEYQVPAGCYYQVIQTATGVGASNTINSISELIL